MVRPVSYADHYFDGVDRLWREAFPADPVRNRAEVAIPAKLAIQPDLFLIALDETDVVGTVIAGYDGHRGWLYSLAVALSHRRRGIATMLVREAESRLHALGCKKVNLQVRAGNEAVVEFYSTLGFAVEERISMGREI